MTEVSRSADKREPLLAVDHLCKTFAPRQAWIKRGSSKPIRAVDDVSFTIADGETFGLVGESGCGKTTVLRCLMRAIEPTSGGIHFRSEGSGTVDLAKLSRRQLRPLRHEMQLIFQNPFTSLNPRMRLFDIIGDPLLVGGMSSRKQRIARVGELLELVGLPPQYMWRFAHAFSGGERQRIGIARALAPKPRLLVGDEPVSALDVSVQAQVLNLLRDLQQKFKLTLLLVSHDLGVVRHLCDRVAVMYLGKIVETAPTEALFTSPKHPYTSALLSAAPIADPRIRTASQILPGDVPSPADPPSGCYFHPRCSFAIEACSSTSPSLESVEPGRHAACLRSSEWAAVPEFNQPAANSGAWAQS
jgi:peptide/nickel transport system ATP-binding protein